MDFDFDHWKLPVRSFTELFDVKHVMSTHLPSLNFTTVTLTVVDETTEDTPFYSNFVYSRFIVGIWELILSIIGVPMNIIIGIMAKNIIGKMDQQENQHLCILSMALADFLFASVHCPIMFVNYALSIDLDPSSCKIVYFVTHLATVASSLSLLWLNIDKFVSLRCPLRYHAIFTFSKTKTCLLVSWIVSLTWALFFVFGPLTAFEEQCQVYTLEPYAYISFLILFFVVPITCSLVISLYVLSVAIEARRTEYRRVSNSIPSRSRLFSNYFSETDHLTSPPTVKRNSNLPAFYNNGSSRNGSIATNDIQIDQFETRRPVSRFKTVTFVFSTTLWSSLTLIPYRTAYLFYHFNPEDWIARISFGLFALMISNASGNPFVTMLTQNQYRSKIKKLFARRKNLNAVGTEMMRRSANSMISLCSIDEVKREGK